MMMHVVMKLLYFKLKKKSSGSISKSTKGKNRLSSDFLKTVLYKWENGITWLIYQAKNI